MNELFLRNLRLSVYGGSHDPEIGVRLGGIPAGEDIDAETLQSFLTRRAPGGKYATKRRETDTPLLLSGVRDGTTDGEEIHAVIRSENMRSSDYPKVPDVPRPSHADYPATVKYGDALDLRGGGHFSGRLTAPLCVAGGIALQILARRGIRIAAHIASLGGVSDRPFDPLDPTPDMDALLAVSDFPVLDASAGEAMREKIEEMRSAGDSVGGTVECAATGLPVGLGEHMFWGMENRIAHLVFGIPGCKGIEFGAGFALAEMQGSAANDAFRTDGTRVYTETNHCGGILGGMTSGMPLLFRCVLKPTPSIALEQKSVSLSRRENTTLRIVGRHDPAIPVRAVPVFEAVAALAVLDALLDADAAKYYTVKNI